MTDTISCPVCQTSAQTRAVLTAEQLRNALGEFYGEAVPGVVDIGSYDIAHCPSSGLEAVGIDLTVSSVEACRARGVEVHCSLLKDFAKARPDERYDAVGPFHCRKQVPIRHR